MAVLHARVDQLDELLKGFLLSNYCVTGAVYIGRLPSGIYFSCQIQVEFTFHLSLDEVNMEEI